MGSMPDHPREWTLERVGDSFAVARECQEHFKTTVWFRGHGRAEWALVPKVCRPDVRRGMEKFAFELAMAEHFRRKAPTRRSSVPDRDDYAAWLSLMQHYGLPTRLLDWSESILVAMYFACTEVSHQAVDGVVWALAPNRLNLATLGTEAMVTASDPVGRVATFLPFGRVQVSDLEFQGMADRIEGGVIAFDPVEDDIRMLVQQSRFTLHGSIDDVSKHVAAPSFLCRIKIPGSLKIPLAQALAAAGIRRSTMFPDLENLSRELERESTFWTSELADIKRSP